LQRRYFKLTTRETGNPDKPFLYTLLWYKKEGGSVIKALEIEKVASIALLQSSRSLSYLPPPQQRLVLTTEAVGALASTAVSVSEVDHEENSKSSSSAAVQVVGLQQVEHYVFLVVQSDGKEHILRGTKLDRVMKWINTIAAVS
jgi:hypothetical protein